MPAPEKQTTNVWCVLCSMSTPSANADPEQDREQPCFLREKTRKDVGTIMTNVILPF